MKCDYCGRSNKRNNEFCAGCGAPIIETNDLADLYFGKEKSTAPYAVFGFSESVSESVSVAPPQTTIEEPEEPNLASLIATGYFEAAKPQYKEYTLTERILKFMGLLD